MCSRRSSSSCSYSYFTSYSGMERKEVKKSNSNKKTKIKIKRIDKKEARQVAFSKRRRGLFSKAEQLEKLCDAKVAAIVFSNASRLYSHSSHSSSINDIIAKYHFTSLNQHQFQLLNAQYAILCEQVAKNSHDLRQLKGEGLEGLGIQQLQTLEDHVETALNQVRKEAVFMDEVKTIQQKLRQMEMVSQKGESLVHEQGTHRQMQPPGHPYLNPNSLPNNDYFVTLKLGLPSSDK